MNIPLINLERQFATLEQEILHSIKKVLKSGNYINGTEVTNLETEIALYTETKYAVSVANGTDALILALQALGIKEGDEVITSPFTFFATGEAIARVGATPVFADIDRKTYNLCPIETEKKITKSTKAIIPVHIFGQPADMNSFMNLAKKYNLYVIEDACQALGAKYKNKSVGGIGHIGCFSFFPTKNLGGYGDGGIVVTNDVNIASKIKLLRVHGSKVKYYNEVIGYNSRLDEIQAAILRVKLPYLDKWNNLRRQKAIYYKENLEFENIISPYENDHCTHVYHLFILQSKYRKQLTQYLTNHGVANGRYYPVPLHLQKAFTSLGYQENDLPVSEELSERSFAIPLYPEILMNEQDFVIKKIKDFYTTKDKR